MNYLGFNQQFESAVLNGEKTSTLRYNPRPIEEGEFVDAIISHDRDAFARLQVMNIDRMTVEEVINTEFDGHQNYDSLSHLQERMGQYYDAEFTLETELVKIEFTVVESLPEQTP